MKQFQYTILECFKSIQEGLEWIVVMVGFKGKEEQCVRSPNWKS